MNYGEPAEEGLTDTTLRSIAGGHRTDISYGSHTAEMAVGAGRVRKATIGLSPVSLSGKDGAGARSLIDD